MSINIASLPSQSQKAVVELFGLRGVLPLTFGFAIGKQSGIEGRIGQLAAERSKQLAHCEDRRTREP
jgi:hypothetical protein